MSLEEIQAAIPHRGSMLLLDEIVRRGEDSIVCKKLFRPDEYFFDGHYPDHPLVPGVILCESAMQAGAVLLAAMFDEAEGVPVAVRMNDVKFKRMVYPGDTVEHEVSLKESIGGAFFMQARIRCQGKIAAQFDFACKLAPAEK